MSAQELAMSLIPEQADATEGSPMPVVPERCGKSRPGLALVKDTDERPSFLREVDCWPNQVWSVWERVSKGLQRRMGGLEAQWTAYAWIMRGKVSLPPLTVHQLPDGGFPVWAERLPACITWVYCYSF